MPQTSLLNRAFEAARLETVGLDVQAFPADCAQEEHLPGALWGHQLCLGQRGVSASHFSKGRRARRGRVGDSGWREGAAFRTLSIRSQFPSAPEGLAPAPWRGAPSLPGVPVPLPAARPSVCRPQTHPGVRSGLAAGGKPPALNPAFVQGSQVGRGPSGPPAPTGMSARRAPAALLRGRLPAHFLSPTDPTTPTRTRARARPNTLTLRHTLPGGPGGLAPGSAIPAAGLREKRPFVIQITPSPRARAAGCGGPGNPSAPAPPAPAPPTAAPPAGRGTPRSPWGLGQPSARGAAPPPPPVRAAAPRSAPSPSPPPLPLPFLSPVQPRSCRLRRRRLPRSAGALPAALPAAWHHPGGISREQHLGEAGSPGVGGCPAASVMDVSKMVSGEQGLCPGACPGPRPPPQPPSLSPSQSA